MSGRSGDDRLYLPLAGGTCRLALRFKGNAISAVEPGPAFDPAEWAQINTTIDRLLSAAPDKVGRNIAFSAFRVLVGGVARGRACKSFRHPLVLRLWRVGCANTRLSSNFRFIQIVRHQ